MRLSLRHPVLQQQTRRSQRGIGLVELMVGITVGLIVAAGAAVVATRQIVEHRRLMLEVQMQQDLRVAADLIQQDLRRAGYRGLPANGVWEPERDGGAVAPKPAQASPYAAITQSTGGGDLFYRYAKNAAGTTRMNTTNSLASNEQFGIKVANKTLYLQLGLVSSLPNWQPITDPDAIEIVGFTPTIVTQQLPLDDLCICPAGTTCTMPTMTVKRVTITINAVSKSDPNVRRTLQLTERIRADDISGTCP
ncbi:MAG: prepilin-type N-terminal cleavage/methylation domain-containing protein [Methylotenera sp.]|jgi:Tfp pilus assembly protein PilW|nr:prepilin-type N-terminal cleavage/methylation domain-containing protein [Methylotenera sp.]